ncbi:hypothetical protein FXO38_09954 [Capsicum annuum]|nr:hypothetical protein FXO38_09954 [Capsicum annuum]
MLPLSSRYLLHFLNPSFYGIFEVKSTCGYQIDPDWAENRSKHRNEPVTMKKLMDKTASKSKKSTSKASKKKFDDSGRPRLPKDNKDELHVWVQGEILKFTMLEFTIISGLKCSSSKSALMSRYFPDNKGAITHSKLITRVQNGNFDNTEDALNLAILFFVHTFIFSQNKEAPISIAHFQIVDDGRYIHFPWGKVTFEKLMSSWQQDFNTVKQLYSLGGMPHVLNVWMFECCSEIESKTTVRQRNAIPRILNWVVQCIRPKYEYFMSGMFTKHSYKNIQPTTDEVSRLNLSFSKDFEICDPTTYASTSDYGKLKRTAVELQQRVGTISEEFGDFSTIPPQEILMKDVHHGSDLYRETHKDAADKGEIGVSEIQHHHYVEIGVSPQSHQHKSVPSSSTQPEETSKSSLDGDEIKNCINKCIFVVIQEDKIDEQQQSQEDESKKSDMQDEIMAYEEEYSDEKLGKKNISDVEDLPDEVGGTITDSIQSAVDTLLFGLSTHSTTKSLDIGASNKMIERHWDLPDSQIPPDFLDAQVRELQASKSKAPAKRERKKSRVLRSPYISKYGSVSTNAVDIDKEEKLKYAFDGYNINQDLPNELMIDYSQWIDLGLLKTHSAKNIKRRTTSSFMWFDCACHARYASLIWHYRVEKANEGYMSDNGDLPRPRKSVIEEIEANAIVTLE